MKRKLSAVIAAVCAVFAVCAVAACNDDGGKNNGGDGNVYASEDGTVVAFCASSSVMTMTETSSVKQYLDVLKENGDIAFNGYGSNNDFFITEINGKAGEVVESTANSYKGYDWMFYIDFTTLTGDEALYGSDYSTVEYEGKTMYSANYGVTGIPCIEGHTYLFKYEYSEMSW